MGFLRDDRYLKSVFRLLRTFCPRELVEEIEGDLEQKYRRDLAAARAARWRLFFNMLRFFRPGIVLRRRFHFRLQTNFMFIHFLKVFLRAALRDKAYSLMNLAGLAVAMVVSLFIFLWISDEVSYDSFHADRDRIVQVMFNHRFESIETYDDTPGPLGPALSGIPEVEEACRLIRFGVRPVITHKGQQFFEEGMYADPSVLRVFTIPVVEGDAKSPLAGPHDIIISRALADKYFPEGNAVGQTMRLNNKDDMRVTAVFENMPGHSTMKFDFILPYALYAKGDQYNNEWGAWSGGECFVKLRTADVLPVVEQKIDAMFVKPHIWVRWDTNVSGFLYPMTQWRLYGNFVDGYPVGGRISYIYWFGGAAIFILLVACANFMNMATARALLRSKEIGVRKVIGALRSSLVKQFLTEAIVLSLMASLVALVVAHLLLPYFNDLTGKQLTIDYANPWLIISIATLSFGTGMIAGFYPAMFLSAGRPISIMKNASGVSGVNVRRALVVFQFTLSTILVVGSVVIYQQIHFMKTMNLGFDRDGMFFMQYREGISRNYDAFMHEALSSGVVTDMTRSSGNPLRVFGGMVLGEDGWPGKTPEEEFVFQVLTTDSRFVDMMKIDVLAGRNFSDALPADSMNYLISEETARLMKLKDPVGATIAAPVKGNVVGVVKDFHTRELRDKIQPVIIRMRIPKEGLLFVRYVPGKMDEALRVMDDLHRKFEPGFPSEIRFMDDTFNESYKDEILVGKLANVFTGIAVFISSLGLFGLVSYAVQKRRREIGIRKVLGADIPYLIGLLCRDFAWLICLSLLIGLPIAWWGSGIFLQRFVYHATPGAFVVFVTIFSLFSLALSAVIIQAFRAASENPVKVLRTE